MLATCPVPPSSSRYGITCSEPEESQLLLRRHTKFIPYRAAHATAVRKPKPAKAVGERVTAIAPGRETKSDDRGFGQEFLEPLPDDQILVPVENSEVSEMFLRHLPQAFDPDAVVLGCLHNGYRIPLVYRNIIFTALRSFRGHLVPLTEGLKGKAPLPGDLQP